MSEKQKNSFCYLALFVFVVYWSSTLLYNTPNNYIRIQFNNYIEVFNLLFQQKWNFFAPPPRSNERIYYRFIDKKDPNKTISFEAFKLITDKKREKAPFNTKEEIVDYVLGGCIGNIRDILAQEVKKSKALNPNKDEKFHIKQAFEVLNKGLFIFNELLTLQNYAKIIAHKNKIDPAQYDFVIMITLVDIPKFKNRHKQHQKREEYLLYKSPKIPFSKVKYKITGSN